MNQINKEVRRQQNAAKFDEHVEQLARGRDIREVKPKFTLKTRRGRGGISGEDKCRDSPNKLWRPLNPSPPEKIITSYYLIFWKKMFFSNRHVLLVRGCMMYLYIYIY